MILGGMGMLGHKLAQVLTNTSELYLTLRQNQVPESLERICSSANFLTGVDVRQFEALFTQIEFVKPHVIFNCVVQKKEPLSAGDALEALTINAELPQRLALLTPEVQVVNISSDGVFSGRKGDYSEDDICDASDFYGKTKALGESSRAGFLNIRTSIIGRQLIGRDGLLEWLLTQRGRTISGYAGTIFSGLPTITLSRILSTLIESGSQLSGVYNIASRPISKFQLLSDLAKSFELDLKIEKVDGPNVDRSLNPRKFTSDTGILVPQWDQMIQELVEDSRQYD